MTDNTGKLKQGELQGIDFVFEMGLRKVDEQVRIIQDIDSKMGILIGFIGTFVALLVGFFLGAEPSKIQTIHRGLTPFVFYLFLVVLLVALVRCFLAFRVRDYFAAFQYRPMVEWTNEEPQQIRNAFIGGVLEAVERNADEIARKRNHARQGTGFILFAVVLLFLVLVSLTLESRSNHGNAPSTTSETSTATEPPPAATPD